MSQDIGDTFAGLGGDTSSPCEPESRMKPALGESARSWPMSGSNAALHVVTGRA